MSAPAGGTPAAETVDHRMGLRLAVLSLAIGLAAVNTGNNLLYLMLALVLALAGLSVAAAAWSLRRLKVAPWLPETVTRGEPFLMGAEVTGRFPLLPQTWVRVRLQGLPERVELDVAVSSETGRGVTSARVTLSHRGVYSDLSVLASTGYPLDLSLRRLRPGWRGELIVLPRFTRLRAMRPAMLSGDGRRGAASAVSARAGGAGTQLHNIREYTARDDARHIDWRSTARTGRLMVREFEREEQRRVDLVLDLQAADDDGFETAVERCAAIVDLARRVPFEVRLLTPGSPAATTSQQMMRRLAEARRTQAPLDAALGQARPDAEVVVISADPARCTPIETEP